MNILNKFQKYKWEILARVNPLYFVWSRDEYLNEDDFRKSGRNNVKEFILEDSIIKNNIKFEDSVVLEIGCGVGRMTEFLADNFKNVIAIDISKNMLAIARDRLKNFKNIEYFVSTGSRIPIDKESADFVFSYIVFHHFLSQKMVLDSLKDIYRILRGGGIAKIQVRGIQIPVFFKMV